MSNYRPLPDEITIKRIQYFNTDSLNMSLSHYKSKGMEILSSAWMDHMLKEPGYGYKKSNEMVARTPYLNIIDHQTYELCLSDAFYDNGFAEGENLTYY